MERLLDKQENGENIAKEKEQRLCDCLDQAIAAHHPIIYAVLAHWQPYAGAVPMALMGIIAGYATDTTRVANNGIGRYRDKTWKRFKTMHLRI